MISGKLMKGILFTIMVGVMLWHLPAFGVKCTPAGEAATIEVGGEVPVTAFGFGFTCSAAMSDAENNGTECENALIKYCEDSERGGAGACEPTYQFVLNADGEKCQQISGMYLTEGDTICHCESPQD